MLLWPRFSHHWLCIGGLYPWRMAFFFYIWKDEILWAKSPVFIHVKKKREMGEVVSSKKLP